MTFDEKISEYKSFLKNNLSEKRYIHSLGVADAAKSLAAHYGLDENKAYMTGLLHDICKELPASEQKELADKSEMSVCPEEKISFKLWHGIAGAVYMKNTLSIDDREMLRAVRFHTVASPDMSEFEQVIYLADLISAEREYKDVELMRQYAYESLDKGMFEALRFSIKDSVKKGYLIPSVTFEAYNRFAKTQLK